MREMKDSGIEWVGAIPAAWGVHRIASHFQEIKEKNTANAYSNALQFKMGKIIAKPQKWDEDETNETYSAYTVVHPNTIMINGLNLEFDFVTQRVARVECNGIITSAYIALSPRDDINAEYICYLLKSYDACRAFHSMGRGLRKILSYSELKNKPIVVPPLAEQERIAAFLDAECAEIDTVLEKTRASIEEYKKLKQAVITRTVTKGIFDKQIYPHNVKLKYLLYIASGDAIRNEELSEVGKYPAYGGGESLGFASKYNTLENSLIVGRVGARCGCVTYIDSKAWATDNALIVHPICNPRYMYYMLIYSQLNNLNTSNAQPLITATKIKNVVVPYFLEDICQRKIVDFLDEKCACIDAIIEKKQQYITEIENYKKSLIYEYVTGKKEVV